MYDSRDGSPWTSERDDLLRELFGRGFSFSLIAQQLSRFGHGFSRNAAIGRARRIGLPPRSKKQPMTQLPPSQGVRTTRSARAGSAQRQVRRTAVAAQAPAAADTPMPFLGLALIELEPHHCRYPQGNEFFKFCGQPRLRGSPYCPHHHGLCFVRGSAR
jgi:GcrA cell cycle regulator